MSKHRFVLSARYEGDDIGDAEQWEFRTVEYEWEFDPDDIYDNEIAAIVRGIARMSMVEAGVRKEHTLGETA